MPSPQLRHRTRGRRPLPPGIRVDWRGVVRVARSPRATPTPTPTPTPTVTVTPALTPASRGLATSGSSSGPRLRRFRLGSR